MKEGGKMNYRVLTLQECLHHDGRKIWMETRDEPGVLTPVAFYAEHAPFLKFDAQDRVLMISVRAEYYGELWRCWDGKTPLTDWMPVKPEEKEPEKKPARKAAGKK